MGLLPLLSGCANNGEQVGRAVSAYMIGDYRQSRQILRPLALKTNEDFVLNNLRLGSACLPDYRLEEGESAFLRAYEVINSVGVNDGGRSLGAALVSENIKIWKGEPFERAMANFYLGLIYYMRHEYDNARGAFENALFKLQIYDEQKDEKQGEAPTNFALGHLMLAKTWQRLGRDDLAQAHFEAVVKLRPDLSSLADARLNAESNVLLVVDVGYGPEKVRESDGDVVGFAPTPHQAGPIAVPRVLVDGRMVNVDAVARPPVDLLALAQDRKWQSIDTIRTIKSAVGTGLIAGGIGYGAYSANRRRGMRSEDALISAGLIGAGLLLKATSQADIRQWEMLPRTTYILPLRLPPGTHDITVEFPGPALQQTWRNLEVPGQGEATYYYRMQKWAGGARDYPPPEASEPVPNLGEGTK